MARSQSSILSDIDFVHNKEWIVKEDQYQLIYGILYDSMYIDAEANIYNRIVKLCQQYKNVPILRNIKIKFWIDVVNQMKTAVERCVNNSLQKNPEFFFPFFAYRYNESTKTIDDISEHDYIPYNVLMYNINFAINILENIKDNDSLELSIYETTNFTYPLKKLSFYFETIVEGFMNQSVEEFSIDMEDIEKEEDCDRNLSICFGIQWEHIRRSSEGLDSDMLYYLPPFIFEFYYYKYFLKYTEDDINLLSSKESNQKQSDKNTPQNTRRQETIKELTGVLSYMLQSFGINDKEQIRKVAHYVATPNKKYYTKTDSNDTVYDYLHHESKLYNVYDKIKETLQRFDIPIPENL